MKIIKLGNFGVMWKPVLRHEMWTQYPRGFWRSTNKRAIGIGPFLFWYRK